MSILASLVSAYHRLEKAPAQGFSSEKIGFVISLNEDGTPAGKPIDLREGEGRKKTPRLIAAPQAVKRTSGVAANFLWDKTSYVLGVTAAPGKSADKEHEKFRETHLEALTGTDDLGLIALRLFLENWRPEDFERLEWPEDMKDQNIIFVLESDRRRDLWLHNRPAAKALWTNLQAATAGANAICLVSGEDAPIARLHPAIKGVWGAQSSGASLVSFNLNAFTSYAHEQGDNAPVSEASAFAYTTALNFFLEKGSGHRIQIGDASTVYWADASDADVAKEAEDCFAALLDPVDENTEAKKVGVVLEDIRLGRDEGDFQPKLTENVRFHVLGLAPNAARLSIRFYIENDFGQIAKNFLAHFERLALEPTQPRDRNAPLWRYLVETASQRKSENVPPNLAGEFLRSILTGAPYPRNLLSVLLMRLRADKDVNALRVALLKAILLRNHFATEAPVSLDPTYKDPGYLLGRLFATYEYAQTQALGGNVNATIRDQYYGTASATPRAVFPLLQRKATHHLARLRKDKPGLAVNLDRDIGEIFELAEPEKLFTPTLTAQRQALFAIGYYHQRNKFFRPKEAATAEAIS